jgi:uncharacterized iron-regulated membrane protein
VSGAVVTYKIIINTIDMKKFLKKIHLWLSVPFGIIITLICLSGASLVFEKEITEAYDHDTYFVAQVGEKAIDLDSLLTKVSATLPDTVEITGVTISNDPERAYQISLSKPRRASIFVDQYTGEITGKGDRLPFFATMFKLHRWLLGSAGDGENISIGKLLVGTSTLLLVIIVLTGLILWLIHPKKSVKISVRQGWPRFWHDLHVSGGVYATIFLLALALTGLTWSFEWYRNTFYSLCGVEASAEGGHGGYHGGGRGGEHNGKGGYSGKGHGRPEGKPDGRPKGKPETISENKSEVKDDIKADLKPEAKPEVKPEAKPEDKPEGRPEGEHHGKYYHEHSADSTAEGSDSEAERHRHYHEHNNGEWHGHHSHDGAEAEQAQATPESAETGRPTEAVQENKPTQRNHHHGRPEGKPAEVATTVVADSIIEEEAPALAPFANWQKAADNVINANPDFRQISVSDGTVALIPAGRNSLRASDDFGFDAATGAITDTTTYDSKDRSVKVRGTIYNVHTGGWGGMLTRILTFLAALLGATLPITGYYIWIKHLRRKGKK